MAVTDVRRSAPTRSSEGTGWRRLRVTACYVTVAATLPYLVMKALWLLGSPVGATDATGAAELLDARHLVGDAVTAGLELVAIALVLALTHRWGRRVPALLVLGPVWVGTGLLAPIAFGAPLGLLVQAVVGGSPAPVGGGAHGWIFVVADGGFVVQAIGLCAAFLGHAAQRWPELFSTRPGRLPVLPRRWRGPVTAAAVVASGYAATLAVWSVTGAGWGGPAGFDTATQRTFLATVGALVLAGAVAVLVLPTRWGDRRVLVPLVPAWLGTATTTMSGPTFIALGDHGHVSPPVVVAGVLAAVSGLVLAGSALRALAGRRHGPVGRLSGPEAVG